MLKEAAGIQRVVLKTGRTDLRRGIDGLKAIIILNGMDPLEKGTLFLFCGRRNDRIRGLTFEGLSAYFCYPHIFSFFLKMIGFKDLFLKNVRITLSNVRITLSTAGHRGGQARLRHQAILVPRLPMR